MNKIRLRYDQLLFMYAYFRMIDLSLDRCKWTSWNEFKNYINAKIPPYNVIKYIENNFNAIKINNIPDDACSSFDESLRFQRIKSLFTKKYYLAQHEFIHAVQLLLSLENYLNSDIKEYNKDIEFMRISFANFCSKRLSKKIFKNELNELMSIEHYLTNDKVKTVSIQKYKPQDFSL